jgi:phenylpyruvate tautomerase PptA (4-oxalocrotonate tautomerase family)
MPLARIDVPTGTSPEHRRAIADTVYEAMVEILKAPKDDRFQILSEHAPGDLLIDPHFLGIDRSAAAIIIQLTLNDGRTVEQKKGFYKAVVDGLQARTGHRPEDVFISLVEVRKENWSFGNGIAQLADPDTAGLWQK